MAVSNAPHPGHDEISCNFFSAIPRSRRNTTSVLKRSSLEEMWKPYLPVVPNDDFHAHARERTMRSQPVSSSTPMVSLKLVGHAGWQNGFRSHFYLDPASRTAYIVAYNTDAQDPTQNTRSFDFELRDYLIDHFFNSR